MTKSEAWQLICERNPALAQEDDYMVGIPVRGARKMFDVVWEMSRDAALDELDRAPKTADLPEGFEELFGKMR